jgi:DNA repair photolyase
MAAAGDTFSTYYGEFLISPIPIELSFNYCSHACRYCFANLNKPDRKAGIKRTLNLLQYRYQRDTLEAFFLREQYPVLISNRVDPFAVSNYRQALPIMELLCDAEIPIAFQTKGGRGIDEALSFVSPSCWYISIASMDEAYRSLVEPGAPTIAERLDLIEKLTAAGHSVSVGINPAVPEWLPNPEALCQAIADRGAFGAWIEPLHFNHRQVKRMGNRGAAAVGEAVIARSLKRRCTPEYVTYLERVEEAAIAAGLEVFSVDHPKPSKFWEPYRRLYSKVFPTTQEFINLLVDSGTPENSLITADMFIDFMLAHLPKGNMRLGHYVGATAHDVCREDPDWSNWMSYEKLLQLLWTDGRIKMCPVRNRAFAWAGDRDHLGKLKTRVDQYGRPIMVFNTSGFDNYHCEV